MQSHFILRRKLATLIAMAGLVICGAGPAFAGTVITYAGSLTDFGPGWRDTSVGKDGFDITKAGIIGADGYSVAGAQGSISLPSYLSAFTSNGSVYGGNGSYLAIDNPTTPFGQPVTLITTGTLNPSPGRNNATTTYTFTIGPNAPALIQIGLLEDNLDIAAYNSSAVELSGTDASGAPKVDLSGSIYNDRQVDWVFFDITAPVAGEVFTVQNFGGANGCACVGAIAFDSVASVPEPGSIGLFAAGLLGLFALHQRRLDRPANRRPARSVNA